jgi:hypothetical protein
MRYPKTLHGARQAVPAVPRRNDWSRSKRKTKPLTSAPFLPPHRINNTLVHFRRIADNHGMLQSVVWFADDCGHTVHVCYGDWVVDRFAAATMTDPVASVRMLAAARAVELALEHRVGLVSVREAGERLA